MNHTIKLQVLFTKKNINDLNLWFLFHIHYVDSKFVSRSNFVMYIQDNIPRVSALPVSLVVTGCSMADTVLSPPTVDGDVIMVTLSAELVPYNDTAEQEKTLLTFKHYYNAKLAMIELFHIANCHTYMHFSRCL